MFKDTKEGSTHHDKDNCYKCNICGDHFFREGLAERCNHDYALAKEILKNIQPPPNAERTGDSGRLKEFKGE